MSNVWCVRAEYGTYTQHFVTGGYAGIGWMPDVDLSLVAKRDDLYPLYRQAHPEDTSNIVIGQQVGQIARFLLEIRPGDYVITPSTDTDLLVENWEDIPEDFQLRVGLKRGLVLA